MQKTMNSITDSLEWESNLKTVNSLVISKILRESKLNESDSTHWESIAYQNPITGGKAVFLARAILFLEIHNENYSARISLLENTSMMDEKVAIHHFSLAPNPANSSCKVYFENIKNDFVLSLKNVLGQTLLETKVAANTHSLEIPLATFDEGMYVVTINDNISIHELKKLIIVR